MPRRRVSRDARAAAPDLVLSLPWQAGAGAAARRRLAGLCDPVDRVVVEHVGVLVDELAAHAPTPACGQRGEAMGLWIRVSPRVVRAEAGELGWGSAGPPPPASLPALDGVAGRGLGLVERLADRWGVTRASPLAIWFELDRRGASLSFGKLPPSMKCWDSSMERGRSPAAPDHGVDGVVR